jgi:hypothetical protein
MLKGNMLRLAHESRLGDAGRRWLLGAGLGYGLAISIRSVYVARRCIDGAGSGGGGGGGGGVCGALAITEASKLRLRPPPPTPLLTQSTVL